MVLLNTATAVSGSSTVGDQHFGVNYLVHLDGEPEDAAVFTNITNDLHGPDPVRFPGGTVGEVGAVGPDKIEGTADDVPALDITVINGNLASSTVGFLSNAAVNDWSVTFVLPMWRFLNVGDQTVEVGEAISKLTAYVAAVIALADAKGVSIDGFELGNEWDILTGETNGSPKTRAELAPFYTAYANLAADLAVVVQDEINDATNAAGGAIYDQFTEPFIAIQALRAWKPNDWLIANDYEAALTAAFTDSSGNTNAAGDAIDAVVAHFYLSQPRDGDEIGGEIADPTGGYTFRNMEDVSAIFTDETDSNDDGLAFLISEWNLSGNIYLGNDENGVAVHGLPTWDQSMGDGIQQLEPIVGIFHTMIAEGVDYANFWAVRQSAWNSLDLPPETSLTLM